MNRASLLLLFVFVTACTGTLTDEQRKKIKENMEQGKIKKVTDAEITEAAFKFGRGIASVQEKKDKTLTNQAFLDSLSRAFDVEIISLQTGSTSLRGIEKQILEAYTQSVPGTSDNVQKMGSDSLIYTKPIVREHPDGSLEFIKALGIRMTRKQIVLGIE